MYRSTGDIQDNYQSFKDIAVSQIDKLCMSSSGSFNDPDMLVVGMYGKGNVGFGGCSDVEYRTHFALWCLFGVPLMMGCDLRTVNETSKALMLNKELIAIDQDGKGRPPYLVGKSGGDPYFFIRHLSNNEFVLAYFKLSEAGHEYRCSASFADLGIPYESGCGLELTDVFTGENPGVKRDYFLPAIEPHGCRRYKAKLVKIK